ncbi:Thymidylate synthase [Aspergillus hancockii]|nr:Thymidylate synthase [Aspergillus hancockii]
MVCEIALKGIAQPEPHPPPPNLRDVIAELLWLISGCTSPLRPSEQSLKIWDGNGSRDLGPVYRFQAANFGVGQLAETMHKLNHNPFDRHHHVRVKPDRSEENGLPALSHEQLVREPTEFPELNNRLDDRRSGVVDQWKLEDFDVNGYNPHEATKMSV